VTLPYERLGDFSVRREIPRGALRGVHTVTNRERMADELQREQGQARQTPNCYPVEDIHLRPSRTPTP
jgi:hypothetical protein